MLAFEASALQIPGVDVGNFKLDDARDKITGIANGRRHLHPLRSHATRSSQSLDRWSSCSLRALPPGRAAAATRCPRAPEPHIIPGGGIGDGPIRGALNVYVIDEDTRNVLSSAAVRVGAADETEPCEALTDSTGLASLQRSGGGRRRRRRRRVASC